MTFAGPENQDHVARARACSPAPAQLAAEALASIDAEIVNRLGDARVTRVHVSGAAGIPARVEDLEPPALVKDAIAFAAGHADGRRAFSLELTSGTCLWLGAGLRLAFIESADDAAARRDALVREGEEAPAPFVRAKR